MQYGLLGEHLPHSHSPKIHKELGNSCYILCEKTPEEVAAFLEKREFHGINVTIPYKETVLPLCDCLDAIAVEIGAVNTIVNCGGSLFGTNTDYYGFIFMCNRARIDFKNKNVLILGSGGAVIACGGGTVKREENRKALRQNGRIVYIKRSLDKLARGGRPLSSGDGAIERLYAERAPIYESLADITVESAQNVADTANTVFMEVAK